MKNSYIGKLIKYMKNIYKIDYGLRSLTDCRINPIYQTGQVLSLTLFDFLLRVRSINELNNLIKDNEFQKLYRRGPNSLKLIQ